MRKPFLPLEHVIHDQLLEKVGRSRFFGLLRDVTDIAVLKSLSPLFSYVVDPSLEKCADFLFVENAPANSKPCKCPDFVYYFDNKVARDEDIDR